MLLSGKQILRRHPVAAAARAARTAWRATPPALPATAGPAVSDDSRQSYLVLSDVKARLIPAIRMQYMQVAGQPGAEGKMVVSWTVLPDGRASNVVLGENTVSLPELRRRVLGAISRWRYPEVPRAVTVSFPFVFG